MPRNLPRILALGVRDSSILGFTRRLAGLSFCLCWGKVWALGAKVSVRAQSLRANKKGELSQQHAAVTAEFGQCARRNAGQRGSLDRLKLYDRRKSKHYSYEMYNHAYPTLEPTCSPTYN